MFRYELNQIVWYMKAGKSHSSRILSRKLVDNAHNDWSSTNEQRTAFQRFGKAGMWYATIHGEFHEAELFPSQEALFRFRLKYGRLAAQ